MKSTSRFSWFDPSTHGVVVLLIVTAIVTWILYPRPREDAAAHGQTEIVFWTPPGPFQEASRLIVEEFERRHPEYRVSLGTATTRDATGDPTRFLLGVAGDVPPDVILFDRFAIVEWASRGAFTNLTPYVEAEDPGDPFAIQEKNFFEPAWSEAVFEDANYAIAMSADTRAMYYNANSLIRAGFVYGEDDPEVLAGHAEAGGARPPRTWEELCLKRFHGVGETTADGEVTIHDFARRPPLNESVPEDASVDLGAVGVRANDILVLTRGENLFRARIAEVTGSDSVRLDLENEQPPNLKSVPSDVQSGAEVRIFSQDTYTARLTRFDPTTGRPREAGFIPMAGSSWFYLFGWQNGGQFMSEDGTECTLADPRLVEAMQWMTDVYDSMGGTIAVSYVSVTDKGGANQASGIQDPFLTGNLALRIDADTFLRDIMLLKPELDFGVVPAPLPRTELEKGVEPFGWGGGWAYAIPESAKNKEGAWELIRWMTSVEANKLLANYEASLARAQGQKYVPRLHADKRVLTWLKEEYVLNNPSVPRKLKEAYATLVDLMPVSRYRPVTPVGQKLWVEQARATEMATERVMTPQAALIEGERNVQDALDRVLNPPTGPEVNWVPLIVLYVLSVIALFAGLVFYQERKHRREGTEKRRWTEGYIAASPWIIGFVVFGGGPVLFSIVISFCAYDGLSSARFIGLENYIHLLGTHIDEASGRRVANDPTFWVSIKNTAFMIIQVPLSIVLGLAIAVLLDSKVKGMTVYRTLYYLPAIVPAVAGFILWLWLFDPGQGLINQMLMKLGMVNPPRWLEDSEWSKPSLILMGLWGVGASMIIWLAGLKDIPVSLHEAASVDGANRVQRFFSVTIPLLTPYILFNLIMGMIAIFQIFEAAYIMTAGGPADSTYFYAYKLFEEAFRYLNMGVASAMAWILFLLVMAVTLLELWSSKKWVHYGG